MAEVLFRFMEVIHFTEILQQVVKKFRDHGRATSTSKVDSSEGYPLLPTSEECETF